MKVIQPLTQDDWVKNNTVILVQRTKSLQKGLFLLTDAQYGRNWQSKSRPTCRQFQPTLVLSTYIPFDCHYWVSDSAFDSLCELADMWLNYTYVGGKYMVMSTGLSWLRTGSYFAGQKTFGFRKSLPPVGFLPV
jgi:hypothetical protein